MIYLVNIEDRDGGSKILGAFRLKETAIDAVKKYAESRYSAKGIKYCLENFGGDLCSGEFYTQDESIEILEKELE